MIPQPPKNFFAFVFGVAAILAMIVVVAEIASRAETAYFERSAER